ncbi:transglutaminase domain-containing protein [Kribbella sp. NBC_01505]|uniref:transglutaminase domain-containing protein n=1 Tax=Kribbella sp. NBC_01505 TaxID=2903580 RepID=UPI00386DAFD9
MPGATINKSFSSAGQVREVVDRIRRVPDSSRRFSESISTAARIHRVGPDLLTQLLDQGLPHRGSGPARMFDSLDLSNVGLALALRCPRWMAMRWWSKALTQLVPDHEVRNLMNISSSCPSPGHAGDCHFVVHPRLVAATQPASFRELGPGLFGFEVRLASKHWFFGDPFTALIDRLLPLQFHLLAYPLNTDLGFLAETGLANCELAAAYLVSQGRELGLPVRISAGYFVARPYAAVHIWTEFRVGDRWLPADPLLLNALARWNVVDARVWPPNRAPQGLLWPVHDRAIELMTHRDHDGLLAPTVTVVDQQLLPIG